MFGRSSSRTTAKPPAARRRQSRAWREWSNVPEDGHVVEVGGGNDLGDRRAPPARAVKPSAIACTRPTASATRAAASEPSATAPRTADTIASTWSSVLSLPRHSRSQPAASARTALSGVPPGLVAPAMSSASVTSTPVNPSSVAQQPGGHRAG